MSYQNFLFLLLTTFAIGCRKPQAEIRLIPQPDSISLSGGTYPLPSEIALYADTLMASEAAMATEAIAMLTGTKVSVTNQFENADIALLATSDSKEPESYHLNITRQGIRIEASTPAGAFYGLQSLYQLINQNTKLPCLTIADKPHFSWRSMHFDVSRHFFPASELKRLIDLAAIHKLNIFHLHLTDDQGWRIEIKSHPELTTKGAWRKGTADDPWNYFVQPAVENEPRYGGFYTQEEMKDLVAYAAARHITIVPEIEMPAHSWAALLAYPQLSCSGKVWQKPGDVPFEFSDPFCAGNEETFDLLEDVLDEVMAIFPSKFIHLGGDEAKKTPWEHCPKCQKRMKAEGLANVEELQSYFIGRMGNYIKSKGREFIGWDEILEGGLAEGAAVMSWRGEEGGIAAAKLNHPVVMANSAKLYFNVAQSHTTTEQHEAGLPVGLLDVYHYDPVPESLSDAEKKFVIGVQSCLWTEYVNNNTQIYDRLLPRLAALSEIAWGLPDKRNEEAFLAAQEPYLAYLDQLGYSYHIPTPGYQASTKLFLETDTLRLTPPYPFASIVYTTDGSEPTRTSTIFNAPIPISRSTTLKAATLLPNGKLSNVITIEFKKGELIPAKQQASVTPGLMLAYREGKINSLAGIDSLKVLRTDTVENFDFPQWVAEDHFSLTFEGFFDAPADGIYGFRCISDDGSRIFIADSLVADNDGNHGMIAREGHVALAKGLHRLRVEYNESLYGQGLEVLFCQGNKDFEPLSVNYLKH